MAITLMNYLELAFAKSLLSYSGAVPAQTPKMNWAWLTCFEFVTYHIVVDAYYKQCISATLKTMVLVLNQMI